MGDKYLKTDNCETEKGKFRKAITGDGRKTMKAEDLIDVEAVKDTEL